MGWKHWSRTRKFALLAVLALGTTVVATVGTAIAQTPHGIELTQSSGVTPNQTIQVTSSGPNDWPASLPVTAYQCTSVGPQGCDTSSASQPITTSEIGEFTVDFQVRASVSAPSGTVDCTTGTSSCYVVVSDAAQQHYGFEQITFKGAPPPPSTTTTTVPSDGDGDGEEEVLPPGPCPALVGADMNPKTWPGAGSATATTRLNGGTYRTDGCVDTVVLSFSRNAAGSPAYFVSYGTTPPLDADQQPMQVGGAAFLELRITTEQFAAEKARLVPIGLPHVREIKSARSDSAGFAVVVVGLSERLPFRISENVTSGKVDLVLEVGPATALADAPAIIRPGTVSVINQIASELNLSCTGPPTTTTTATSMSCPAAGSGGVGAKVTATIDAKNELLSVVCEVVVPLDVADAAKSTARSVVSRCANLGYRGSTGDSRSWAQSALSLSQASLLEYTRVVGQAKLAARVQARGGGFGTKRELVYTVSVTGVPVQTECDVPGSDTAAKVTLPKGNPAPTFADVRITKGGCADKVILKYNLPSEQPLPAYQLTYSGSTVDLYVQGTTSPGISVGAKLPASGTRYVRSISKAAESVVRIEVDRVRTTRVTIGRDSQGRVELSVLFGGTGSDFPGTRSIRSIDASTFKKQIEQRGLVFGVPTPYGKGSQIIATPRPGAPPWQVTLMTDADGKVLGIECRSSDTSSFRGGLAALCAAAPYKQQAATDASTWVTSNDAWLLLRPDQSVSRVAAPARVELAMLLIEGRPWFVVRVSAP